METKTMKTIGKYKIMVIIQIHPAAVTGQVEKEWVAVVRIRGSGGMVGAAEFACSFCLFAVWN